MDKNEPCRGGKEYELPPNYPVGCNDFGFYYGIGDPLPDDVACAAIESYWRREAENPNAEQKAMEHAEAWAARHREMKARAVLARYEKTIGDARPLAAAPELLAALKEMLDARVDPMGLAAARADIRARAALAKYEKGE